MTPRSGEELAAAAGREVAAFDVVLVSQRAENEGRLVILEVGSHGLSIRDPFGALLKVVALEHLTGWKSDAELGLFTVIISKDLETFHRMAFQTNLSAAIEAAVDQLAERRANASSPTGPPKARGSGLGFLCALPFGSSAVC